MSSDGGGEGVEGVELFDGAVGGEGDGDAGVQHRFEGIGPGGAGGAEAMGGPGVGGDELGLDGGDDFVFGHSLEAVGRAEGGVLDAVAVGWGDFAVEGECGGVEGFAWRLSAAG